MVSLCCRLLEGLRVSRTHVREKKPKRKKFGGTPPLLDSNHLVDMSGLSRGNVPSVPLTFCPIYVELHINQVGMSWMSGAPPHTVPRTLPRHTDHQTPLCVLSFSVCLLPSERPPTLFVGMLYSQHIDLSFGYLGMEDIVCEPGWLPEVAHNRSSQIIMPIPLF